MTSFPRQKCKNLKDRKDTFFWNGEFHVVANFQVNCGKPNKDEWRWAFLMLHVLIVLWLFQCQIRESRIQFGECSVSLTEQIAIVLTSWSCNKKRLNDEYIMVSTFMVALDLSLIKIAKVKIWHWFVVAVNSQIKFSKCEIRGTTVAWTISAKRGLPH